MFQLILASLDRLMKIANGPRVLWTLLLLAGVITITVFYENRQRIYQVVLNDPIIGDYKLEPPKKDGRELISQYLASETAVMALGLIDSDPLNNQRHPVEFFSNNTDIRNQLNSKNSTLPAPLFTSRQENNIMIMNLINGEMVCGELAPDEWPESLRARPQVVCRVPLPPAFKKNTGWFVMYLSEAPRDRDRFKFSALSLSLSYYNIEIMKKEATRGDRLPE